MLIDLSRSEIEIIAKDQEGALESDHLGDTQDCGDLSDCPVNHFHIDIDLADAAGLRAFRNEIKDRQQLLKLIGRALEKCR